MLVQKDYKFWFCTGSQDLYGDECLAHVAEHSQIIVKALNESGILPNTSSVLLSSKSHILPLAKCAEQATH